jgi:hypothetical protein
MGRYLLAPSLHLPGQHSHTLRRRISKSVALTIEESMDMLLRRATHGGLSLQRSP